MNIPIPFPHVKDMPDYILVPKIKDKVPLETAEFFYGDAGRMFINLYREYKQYGTDCNDVIEFINESYFDIMRLRTRVRTRKIDDFNISMDENRFKGWLRETVENYCKDTIKRKKAYIEILEKMPMDDFCEADEVMVVFIRNELRMDIERVLKIMPCKEYAECIRLIYLDHKLPIEVAKALGKTTRGSFDTLHTRAKLQFKQVYKKEMGK